MRASFHLCAGLMLAFAASFPAHGFSSAPYFPLTNGYNWTYQENGIGSYTRTVQGPVTFNGATVMSFYYSPENNYLYFTNDANGIRGHGAFYPNEFDPDCGVGETDVLQPFRYATPDITLGQIINDSGTGSATIGPCSLPLTYTSQSQIATFETVSVPLGTFLALKVIYNRTISYLGTPVTTLSATYWLAQNVGLVKAAEIEDGFPYTYTLTGTNVVRTAPDAFSFPPQTGVALNSPITSNTITVTGTTAASTINITDGEYKIGTGAFTSAQGTVQNGQTVTVRQTSSASPTTTTNATLTIGGVSAMFSVTTASLPSHTLTVQTTGNGTITSNPAGINCGATCSASYLQGTSVTLTATPGAGTPLFSGWSGGGCSGTGTCTMQVNAPLTVTATFVADTVAPTVPTGLTATAVGTTQINLAWTAATDNVGVAAYRLFRDGSFRVTVNNPATGFGDTGLTASTAYSYTVAACDATGNCSAQSASASATTPAAGSATFTPVLASSWNLVGNSLDITLNVVAIFGSTALPVAGITSNIASVWKWDAAQQSWYYYSPALSPIQLQTFAESRGYQVLVTIGQGEGYWVNAAGAVTLPAQSGSNFSINDVNFSALPSSWNLVATAANTSPHVFANTVSGSPPPTGGVNDSFLSLWAWDAAQQTWYYYSPALENTGNPKCGLPCVKAYTDARGLLHFEDTGKKLDIGVGFWVNRR